MEFLETTARKIRPLRRSLPRAQGDERIEYHPVNLQARPECALARAKCPLGRNADVIDAGLPWRRLDALDQSRYRDSNLWDEAAGAREEDAFWFCRKGLVPSIELD